MTDCSDTIITTKILLWLDCFWRQRKSGQDWQMNGGRWIVHLKADGENQRASMAGLTETHLPLVLDQFLLLVYFLALTESEQLNLRHQGTVGKSSQWWADRYQINWLTCFARAKAATIHWKIEMVDEEGSGSNLSRWHEKIKWISGLLSLVTYLSCFLNTHWSPSTFSMINCRGWKDLGMAYRWTNVICQH